MVGVGVERPGSESGSPFPKINPCFGLPRLTLSSQAKSIVEVNRVVIYISYMR